MLAIQETVEERTYRVLPDTGLVIGFQYKGKLAYVDGDTEISLSTSGVTGLRDDYRLFKSSAHIGTVLVIFKEAAAVTFFKEPLHQLFKESLALDNFMLSSELLILEEKLQEAKSDTTRIDIIERFLIARIIPIEPDNLILAALSLIHKSNGNIRIKELAGRLNISLSPFEKRFRRTVGASPKKYASIVRMKGAIQNHLSGQSLTDLSYQAGFYDQAHFIKEFRTHTGTTPEAFFASKE